MTTKTDLVSDEVIKALEWKCSMTKLEALSTLDVIADALDVDGPHGIIEYEVMKFIEAIRVAAIEAANGVDVRAGDDVTIAIDHAVKMIEQEIYQRTHKIPHP